MDRPRRIAAILAPALLLAACTFYDREYFVGSERLELARIARDDGSTETCVLEVNQGRAGADLQVITEYDRQRAFLGFKVMELDRVYAEQRGLRPGQGLLVTGTYPHSAAESGGVLAGDVLLAVGGEATVREDQLPRAESRLHPDEAVAVRIRRGEAERELTLVPRALREHVVDPQTIALEEPAASRPCAGVILLGIPRVWCDRMFGGGRNGVVLGGVDLGSPAWVAGFRAGDLIEAVDGAPVPTVHELARAIAEAGERDGSIALRVRRGADDRHEATIALADYRPTRQVWLPLVCHVEDGPGQDRWSVGPFGLLCSNSNRYDPDSRARAPRTQNEFDVLFGLVHVESRPGRDHLRLLWFIDIDL